MENQPRYTQVHLDLVEKRIRHLQDQGRDYSALLKKVNDDDPVGYNILKRNLNETLRSELGVDEEAVLYNGLRTRDQDAVLKIYSSKYRDGEFEPELLPDKVKRIEDIARDYIAQICAFEDVLTEKGYDPVSEVLKNQDVGIAALSSNARLMIFGRIGKRGRPFNAKGLHLLGLNYENAIAYPKNDLKLGTSADVRVVRPNGGFKTSCLRGLATNKNAPSEPDLHDYAQTIIGNIDDTYRDFFDLDDEDLKESYRGLKVKY